MNSRLPSYVLAVLVTSDIAFGRSDPANHVAALRGSSTSGTFDLARETDAAVLDVDELRIRVTAEGVALEHSGLPHGRATLSTGGFGRGDELCATSPVLRSLTAERVEIAHAECIEWFRPGRDGVEQGFTFATRPEGPRDAPLTIDLRIEGGLGAQISADGRAATLFDGGGVPRASYRGLVAFDASGRVLEAQLASSPAGLCIRVDDRDALYPLTVDPWIGSPYQTIWGASNDKQLGRSVRGAGDLNGDGFGDLLIGANGQIWLHYGSASGLHPTLAYELDAAPAYGLGTSVSTAGDFNGDGYDDFVYGAPQFPTFQVAVGYGGASGLSSWFGYEFHLEAQRVGATLPPEAGRSVTHLGDLNGDGRSEIAFGIPFDDPASGDGTRIGSVRVVFGGTLSMITIQAPASAIPTGFGWSVANGGDLDGNGTFELLIGAPYAYQAHATTAAGRYYRATYDGGGFTLTESALPPGNYELARGLAGGGDVDGDGLADALAGTPGYSPYGGAVAFSGGLNDNVWSMIGASGDEAGAAVAIVGDVNGDGFADILVGSPKHDGGIGEAGRADLYFGGFPQPSPAPSFTRVGDVSFGHLGHSVGAAGDINGDGYSDFLIGAPDYDDVFGSPPLTRCGRVWIHYGHANLPRQPQIATGSAPTGARMGSSVCNLGDVNGDGFEDVAIGAPQWSQGQANEGAFVVYLGSAAGIAQTPLVTVQSNVVNAQLGTSIAGIGDLDGDGYGDVAVGAPFYTNGQVGEGAVFIHRGGPSGTSASPNWVLERNQIDARFGMRVARAGDLNRDGFADFAVGAPDGSDGVTLQQGEVWVYYGSPFGPTYLAPTVLRGPHTGSSFGWAIAGAGRSDADVYDDLVVGAPTFVNGDVNEGVLYVFSGSPTGVATTPALTIEGNFPQIFWGEVLTGLGDANGDGFDDVAVGCPRCYSTQAEEGEVWIYYGSPTGLSAYLGIQGGQQYGHFGQSVSGAGDVDGNGMTDMIVGADDFDDGALVDAGRVTLFLGYASGVNPNASWTVTGDQSGARLGSAVSSAGDLNADGFADLVYGAPGYDLVSTDKGLAYVSQGNSSGGSEPRSGTKIRAGQLRGNGLTPLLAGGSTHHPSAFRIRTTWSGAVVSSSTALGRTKAQTQIQVAAVGASFAGSTIVPAPLPFVDTGAATSTPTDWVTYFGYGPAADGYKWRVRVALDDPLLPQTPWVTLSALASTSRKLLQPPDCDGDQIADHVEIVAGSQTDVNQDLVPDACAASGTVYCTGDGLAAACPCGNSAPVGLGLGCLNSQGNGARLRAAGSASLSNDTLVLSASQMPDSSALYFQGTTRLANGLGAPFGDGLRCTGGTVIRLGTRTNVGGASQYPSGGAPSVSVIGLVSSPGKRTYQVWYRNAATFCTASTFNLSNGFEVTWGS